MLSQPKATIPATRADVVGLFCRHFETMGAPVERLLEQSAIPCENLDVPGAVVPLRNAYHFAQLACSSLGSEHLGLYIGLVNSPDNYGAYGRSLQSACTVGAYLQKGIDYLSLVNSGERFWMSVHGEELRLNISSPGPCTPGSHQSHLSTLMMTVVQLRKAAGPEWCPREIGLAYNSPEPVPPIDVFANAHVVQGLQHSYLTFPRSLMHRRLPRQDSTKASALERPPDPLPMDFVGLVMNQIGALSTSGRDLHIDSIAQSFGMSRRTLQRAIGRQGLTYFELVNQYHMHKAAQSLEQSEKPVIEIALELGYTDASNFARAFRRHTGLSPSAYRTERARGDR